MNRILTWLVILPALVACTPKNATDPANGQSASAGSAAAKAPTATVVPSSSPEATTPPSPTPETPESETPESGAEAEDNAKDNVAANATDDEPQTVAERMKAIAARFVTANNAATEALARGDRSAAHKHLDQALDYQPTNVGALRTKIYLSREDGRLPEALERVDRALQHRPFNSGWHYQRAEILYDMKEIDGALESLRQALLNSEKHPMARYLQAKILSERQNKDGALLSLEEAHANGFLDLRRLERDAGNSFQWLAQEERFISVVEAMREWHRSANALKNIETHIDRMVEHRRHVQEPPPENGAESDGEALLAAMGKRIASGGEPFELAAASALDGRPLDVREFAGKPVVLHIWGTWSPAGRGMLSDLARLQAELADHGLMVVTLAHEYLMDARSAAELVKKFQAALPTHLRTALVDEKILDRLSLDAFPSTMFIGRDGLAYSISSGKKSFEQLKSLAEKLLSIPAKR